MIQPQSILLAGRFYPSVGGVERIMLDLAAAFNKRGHKVTIATPTELNGANEIQGYRVVRAPNLLHLIKLCRDHDTVLLVGLALKVYLPAVIVNRNVWVSHQTLLPKCTLSDRLKQWIARYERRAIACSAFLARCVAPRAHLIGNPCNLCIFDQARASEGSLSNRTGIVFIGRLDRCKGVDLLLEALARIPVKLYGHLTIVGDGDQLHTLKKQAKALAVAARFVGCRDVGEIASIASVHDICVVPSRWAEPFGIVALEGLAAGCRTVVSDSCGLVEAVGSFGTTFRRGDSDSLADVLTRLLQNPEQIRPDPSGGPLREHLELHSVAAVAERYLQLITRR